MSEFQQISTTTGARDTAERIATELVSLRLAACVQIVGPIQSTYRWQGVIEESEEWLCLAKCRADRFADVEALVNELHPYDTPELIATPIVATSTAYGDWLRSELPTGEA